MIRFSNYAMIILLILVTACQGNTGDTSSNESSNKINHTGTVSHAVYQISGDHAENDSVLLRVAFLGDGEPKPLAEFPHMADAVNQINSLSRLHKIDFVIGVGDIAHKGTEIQYEAATEVLIQLDPPFYPIMGNEEHESTLERYLYYARKWNSEISSPSYVLDHEEVAFVLASPDHSRDFNDEGALWIKEQLQSLTPKPVILVVHSAQTGVYPENAEKGVTNTLFREQVITQPNLAAVVSGDLHMDMDRVNHSKKMDHIHYLHIPALERTKIPDDTRHNPMFRVMTITKNGNVSVETFSTVGSSPIGEHFYSFSLEEFNY